MDADAARRLYRLLRGDRFSFVYAGAFPEDHSAHLIPLGAAAAGLLGRPRLRMQRLAYIMVEAYQNITRHRAAGPDGRAECSFAVRLRPEADSVTAVNPVRDEEAGALEQAMAHIRSATAHQLRAFFLARLSTGSATARGGAGLGLIEMARRSGQDLLHRLLPHGDGRELFALHAALGKKAGASDLDAALELHREAIGTGLILAMRGGEDAEAREAVRRMAEAELGGQEARAVQAWMAAASWLWQQGGHPDGMLCLGREGGAPALCLLWEPQPGARAREEALVQRLAGLTPFEADGLYRRAVMGEEVEGAGLIELARIQRAPLALQAADGVLGIAVRL